MCRASAVALELARARPRLRDSAPFGHAAAVGDAASIGERARTAFEQQWSGGDHWQLEHELDRRSHQRQLELVADRRYGRALEVGCGAGAFTARLATVADEVLAIDIASGAIERARGRPIDGDVEFRVQNVMELDVEAEGPWDLVVLSETIYCLGWLYPLFDVGWLVSCLLAAAGDRGRVLMANTYGAERDHLLRPWLIDTYRDLFLNVGFVAEHEETLRGEKDGVTFDILISLFAAPPRRA